MGHYVYKYVFNGEIIYIGKCDADLDQRLAQHGKPGDNIDKKYWDDINASDIYYCTLANATMSDVVESELINRHKPKCNTAKMSDWDGLKLPEPNWKKYYKKINKEHIFSAFLPYMRYTEIKGYDGGHIIFVNKAMKNIICQNLNLSIYSIDKAISEFTKAGIFKRLDVGMYQVNPNIVCRVQNRDTFDSLCGQKIKIIKFMLENMSKNDNTLKCTRREIAKLVPASKTTVNETIKLLAQADLIKYKRGLIMISPRFMNNWKAQKEANMLVQFKEFN